MILSELILDRREFKRLIEDCETGEEGEVAELNKIEMNKFKVFYNIFILFI